MDFVAGGNEALELMAQQRFDVVVSDMRMPGIDGAQLLEIILKEHPHTIRIMLTGQALLGMYTKMDSAARAVALLGLDTIKVLVLSLELFSKINLFNKNNSLNNMAG